MSLLNIQSELKAPKNQYNSFGKYKYRSTEDILEAVKPLLLKYGCIMTISDSIQEKAGIIFCESSIKFIDKDGKEFISTASAGIDPNRKGMDIAQSFGASASYSRKYALNALFLIDDTKDPDATNTHGKEEKPKLELDSITYEKCRAAYLKDKRNLPLIQEKYEIDAETLKALMNEKV
ncbi:MAG: ERF family protein [Gloeomargaritales cyanobacterium]